MTVRPLVRFAAVAVLPALILAGCGDDYSWRQKLTVEVETPQGTRTASSVSAVGMSVSEGWWLTPEARGGHTSLSGEAVVVEVAPGQYLFALIGGLDHLAQKVFAPEIGLDKRPPAMPKFEVWAGALSKLRMRREVPRKDYPLLVTFADIADPKTVRRVDPDDLAASFGPGVALKSITLEITDEKVTKGRVEQVLSYFWWPEEKRREYTCRTVGCGRNPIRVQFPDGTTDTLTKLDFARE